MAQTPRTFAELVTLFADNTSGAISPEDLRDFLVSSQGGYGMIGTATESTGQATVAATPTKLTEWNNGATGFNGASQDTTPDFASSELTVAVAGVYLVQASLYFNLSGTIPHNTVFSIYVNAAFPGSPNGIRAAMDNFDALENHAVHLSGIITLAASATLSVFLSSEAGSDTFKLGAFSNLSARRIG